MEDEEEGEEPDGENMQQSLGGGTVADVPATRGRSNDPLFPHCVGLRKDIVERKNQNNIITNPLSDANGLTQATIGYIGWGQNSGSFLFKKS